MSTNNKSTVQQIHIITGKYLVNLLGEKFLHTNCGLNLMLGVQLSNRRVAEAADHHSLFVAVNNLVSILHNEQHSLN